jgi:hypothetical protein
VHLQAERPNGISALVNRDAIPVERVRVGLRLPLAGTKHPDLGFVLWPLSGTVGIGLRQLSRVLVETFEVQS